MTTDSYSASKSVTPAEQQQLLQDMENRLNSRAMRSAWYAFSVMAVIIVLLVVLSGVSHEWLESSLSNGASTIGGMLWN